MNIYKPVGKKASGPDMTVPAGKKSSDVNYAGFTIDERLIIKKLTQR